MIPSRSGSYWSTAPEMERPKVNLWEYKLLIALAVGGVAVAILAWVAAGGTFITWLLSALALALFCRLMWALKEAMQAPLLGVNAREADDNIGARSPDPDTIVETSMVAEGFLQEEVVRSEPTFHRGEEALYKKRFHILALIESLLRVAPITLLMWVFALLITSLASTPNREKVVQALLVATVVTGIVFLITFDKEKKRHWLRWPAGVGFVITVICLIALQSSEMQMIMSGGLFFVGGFLLLQRWAKWRHTYIIVTKTQFSIELESPWFYLLKDSEPSVPVKKLTSVKAGKSQFEKTFNLNCGTIEADTPGQKDDDFHQMRRVVDHLGLSDILGALIA